MRIGIDVGGTHTDGVLIENGSVSSWKKVPTDHENLMQSLTNVLLFLLQNVDIKQVETINLSTTLCTNTIATNRVDPVGMLVFGGPGVDPREYAIGSSFHVLSGTLDHRGSETSPVDEEQIAEAIATCKKQDISHFGIAGKFSTRNPALELSAKSVLERNGAEHCTLGHQLSGSLNFPRRINTTYFNAAVWQTYNNFMNAIRESLKAVDYAGKVNIVKADGGTFTLDTSRKTPVQSIFSGPAASIMGMLALLPHKDDAFVLDVGGTTTDIALFSQGIPLLEPKGISIQDKPTLVRALRISSIPLGGDTIISEKNGEVEFISNFSPTTSPADLPTITDAFNVLGLSSFGDTALSSKRIKTLSDTLKLSSEKLASSVATSISSIIAQSSQGFLQRINAKPVYTIHELLEEKPITPSNVFVMGGPAEALVEPLKQSFSMPVTVPAHAQVANAVGAAMTKTTFSLELYADTPKKRLIVPSLNVKKDIPHSYTLDEATEEAQRLLVEEVQKTSPGEPFETQLLESSSFTMVEGYSASGKSIRVRCQTKPGVIGEVN